MEIPIEMIKLRLSASVCFVNREFVFAHKIANLFWMVVIPK